MSTPATSSTPAAVEGETVVKLCCFIRSILEPIGMLNAATAKERYGFSQQQYEETRNRILQQVFDPQLRSVTYEEIRRNPKMAFEEKVTMADEEYLKLLKDPFLTMAIEPRCEQCIEHGTECRGPLLPIAKVEFDCSGCYERYVERRRQCGCGAAHLHS